MFKKKQPEPKKIEVTRSGLRPALPPNVVEVGSDGEIINLEELKKAYQRWESQNLSQIRQAMEKYHLTEQQVIEAIEIYLEAAKRMRKYE